MIDYLFIHRARAQGAGARLRGLAQVASADRLLISWPGIVASLRSDLIQPDAGRAAR